MIYELMKKVTVYNILLGRRQQSRKTKQQIS